MMDAVSSGDILIDGESLHDVILNAYLDAYAIQLDASDGQSISSTAISYFRGILQNRWLPTNYVMWVGSPYYYWQNNYERVGYEYQMAYGNNLVLDNGTFSGSVDLCTIRLYPTPSVTVQHDYDISVSPPLYYSRSNLGDFSGEIQFNWSGFLILFSLMIGGLVWLINSFIGRLRS